MERWIERLAEKDSWFYEHPVTLEWFGARWVPGEIDRPTTVKSLTENFSTVM